MLNRIVYKIKKSTVGNCIKIINIESRGKKLIINYDVKGEVK